jgi:hypothetical protein
VNFARRVAALASTLLVLFAVLFAFVRPWYLRWGASDEEVQRVLPGDEIVSRVEFQETRAITIDAPVERVWPWLAQLGQDRGGFYSFDLLENLVGCEMPTVDRLRPERQNWRVGDKLWMYPPRKGGGQGYATLRVYVPGRVLGFGAHSPGKGGGAPEDGSWTLRVEPIDRGHTRLIARGRGVGGRAMLGVAFDYAAFEPMHYVMERRMMIGLRDLAEGRERGRLANHVHVVLWTATFLVFVAAFVGVLRRERWGRAWLAFALAGVTFAFLTLVQPPLALGAALVAVLVLLLWAPDPGARVRAAGRTQVVELERSVADDPPRRFTRADLAGLPPPVVRYLRQAIPEDAECVRLARVTSRGVFRTGTSPRSWRPFRAEQVFSASWPGFVWDARIRMAPGVEAHVRDTLIEGRASMSASLLGLLRLASVSDQRELAMGALHRWLAEALWFPTSLLPSAYLQWSAIDERTARATAHDGATSVWLDFQFGPDMWPTCVETPARYRDVKGRAVPTPWRVEFGPFEPRGGFHIPIAAEVQWLLPDGPWPYWRGAVLNAEYVPGRAFARAA